MGVATSIEHKHGTRRHIGINVLELDWTALCPQFVSHSVESAGNLRFLATYEQKLRFVEAVIFATVVMYGIICAAWPAFYPVVISPV